MKTKIIQYSTTNDEYKWYLDGNEITTKEDAIHLGIIRSEKNECSKNIEARLENARCTTYVLMGSGFHGTDCMDAVTSYTIYHTYVLPRLIYGLEVLPLKKKHVENLETFHRKSIHYLQSLPQRIATAAIYLLVGTIPIETELHKRKLSLLCSMPASDNSKIKEIINREISLSYDNEDSFFGSIRDILMLFDVPSITDLQANLPSKISWRKLVRKEVDKLWLKRLQNDATAKTTLIYLAIKHLEVGTSHPLWKMKSKTRIAVRKSIIKARIITGTLVLQKDRHRFNKFDISSICPMCKLEDEDIIHFLLKCVLLAGSRQEPFRLLKNEVINDSEDGTGLRIFNNEERITTLIIDCRNYSETFMESASVMDRIEELSIELCYSLYVRRLQCTQET
jgi:hypothetical protein